MSYFGIIIVLVVLLVVAGIAFAFAMFKAQAERIESIEKKLGVSAVPFWKYSLSVIAEILIHPHQRYAGMDVLVKEALLEPAVRMPEERSALLDTLLDARSLDMSTDMRPGERDAAIAFKHTLRMVRLEAESDVGLSGFTVVGRQAPVAQQEGEEPKLV